eukprot:351151-Chlamydomonas_euryale.AAC.1
MQARMCFSQTLQHRAHAWPTSHHPLAWDLAAQRVPLHPGLVTAGSDVVRAAAQGAGHVTVNRPDEMARSAGVDSLMDAGATETVELAQPQR